MPWRSSWDPATASSCRLARSTPRWWAPPAAPASRGIARPSLWVRMGRSALATARRAAYPRGACTDRPRRQQPMTEPTPATASAAVPTFGRRHLAILGGLLAVAVFVGLTLGGVLSGDRGGGSLGASAGSVPADAVIYLEARLDLPGAQRAQLRALLDRFPAVNPDDVLTDALAHTLDEALSGGDAPFDYSNDVAPWFTGRIGLAMLDYPVDPAAMRLPSMLVLRGTRDAAAATALADALRTELESDGTSFRSSDHGGVTVWSLAVEADPMAAPISGLGFAYAVSDDQLLLASGADVIATALDVHGGAASSLAGRDDVRSLVGTLPDEAAAFAVVNSQAMLDQMT